MLRFAVTAISWHEQTATVGHCVLQEQVLFHITNRQIWCPRAEQPACATTAEPETKVTSYTLLELLELQSLNRILHKCFFVSLRIRCPGLVLVVYEALAKGDDRDRETLAPILWHQCLYSITYPNCFVSHIYIYPVCIYIYTYNKYVLIIM